MIDINGALSGLKIVACSTAQAGTVPYMLMADLGAEVIKIETPGKGDMNRVVNQTKYSLGLDLIRIAKENGKDSEEYKEALEAWRNA